MTSSQPLHEAIFLTAESPPEAAVRFWTEVTLDQPRNEVRTAHLTATAHGVYEARIDGIAVSDSVLDPGWTSYEWRLAYQHHDVGDLVRSGTGKLRVELLLGNGWFRGDLGFAHADANYGTDIAVGAVMEITYRDGAKQHIATSPDWVGESTEITRNSLYNGQTIDARLRGQGAPLPVRLADVDRSTLVPQVGPPVRRQETIRPNRIWSSPSGRTLVDFGQNLVGWLRFNVRGPAGTRITIRHAEVLEDGELGTRPLRSAEATDIFICRARTTPSSRRSPSTDSATRRSRVGPAT